MMPLRGWATLLHAARMYALRAHYMHDSRMGSVFLCSQRLCESHPLDSISRGAAENAEKDLVHKRSHR
jgi:hypothetical protein